MARYGYEALLWDTIALTVAMKLVIFAMFGLYSKLWRFFCSG